MTSLTDAAVSLVLDLPFLLICLGVMLWHSVTLSAICVGILAVIAIASASALMAPVFQAQLNHQFLLGARNQAFITEHLASAFQTKQIANTYNTVANTLQQVMTLSILLVGAYMVMTPSFGTAPGESAFTVGMLVAFQMFAGKLSKYTDFVAIDLVHKDPNGTVMTCSGKPPDYNSLKRHKPCTTSPKPKSKPLKPKRPNRAVAAWCH